jgi:signal transduction histidine kinase
VAEVDPRRIEQVIANFLSNALKFTPPGGRVAVSLKPSSEGVEFTVADNGHGLNPEDLPNLFQPFSRIGTLVQGKHSGTGLGLFICKGIVEAHGGRVGVESKGPGKGSTFSAWLPRKQPTATAQAPRHP